MTIAKRVRDLRYAKGWGPDELASRADISRTALYQIECGKTETPRAGTLRRIAEALGVTIEALMGAEDGRALAIPTFHSTAQGSADATPNPWRTLPLHEARNGGGWSASPNQDHLARKFQDLLAFPLGEGIARMIEDAHRLLPEGQNRASG